MPDCDYCGESFDDEDAYLRHLGAEHEGELGRIERRRVEQVGEGDGGFSIPTGPAILGGVLLVALVLVVYVVFVFGGGGGGGGGPVHAHGTANVTVEGDRIDFSQPQYQMAADFFHFEPLDNQPNGRIWHKHARDVTLAEAMETLGIGLEPGVVTFQGTTYRDDDPDYEVRIEVDGESVDPTTYTLSGVGSVNNVENGDSIHIVVRRTNGSG